MHSPHLAAGYISEFFSRHWERKLQQLEAEQPGSPTSARVENKRAVTYACTHSDADSFSGVDRDDASAASLAKTREHLIPGTVDPHRRTDEQLARFGDLRFTISSSDAGFYIGHTRLNANTMMSIMLQLAGFVILLDELSGKST